MKSGSRAGIALLAIAIFLLLAVATLSPPIYRVHKPAGFSQHIQLNADIQAIKVQLQQYKAMNGFYPTTAQGLEALVIQPTTNPHPSSWSQMFREVPKDPWGNKYVYVCPGTKKPDTYDLFSAGPDRIANTADDDWGE